MVILDFLTSIELFNRYPVLIDISFFLISLVITWLLTGKRGVINLIKGVVKKMIYRKPSYREEEKATDVKTGQTFPTLKPVYRLNKETNTLVKTDETIDIVEFVQSSLKTCLELLYERFLPEADESELVAERNALVDDLDVLTNTSMLAEKYRQEFNLPVNSTFQEVFNAVKERADVLDNYVKQKENGGSSDEKENIEKDE